MEENITKQIASRSVNLSGKADHLQVSNIDFCIIRDRNASSYAYWWHAIDGTEGGKRIVYSTCTFHRSSTQFLISRPPMVSPKRSETQGYTALHEKAQACCKKKTDFIEKNGFDMFMCFFSPAPPRPSAATHGECKTCLGFDRPPPLHFMFVSSCFVSLCVQI